MKSGIWDASKWLFVLEWLTTSFLIWGLYKIIFEYFKKNVLLLVEFKKKLLFELEASINKQIFHCIMHQQALFSLNFGVKGSMTVAVKI